LRFVHLEPGQPCRVAAPTFIPKEMANPLGPYSLQASPTLYPGQIIRTRLSADPKNKAPVICSIIVYRYSSQDEIEIIHGPAFTLGVGADHIFSWRIPDQGEAPI
jgi:hypothetical protein